MGYRSSLPPLVRIAPIRGVNQRVRPEYLSPEFTSDAEDCYYDNGYIVSAKGSKEVNSTAISGSPKIMRIHGYAKSDGSRTTLIQSDGDIRKQVGTAFDTVLASSITGERYRFANGLDLCLVARGYSQYPSYWDGDTMRIISQVPIALYPFFYQDHFCIGNLQGPGTKGSQVRFSEQRNLFAWNSGDVFNIETQDAEKITGIAQEDRYLCVFKNSSRTLIYGTFFKISSSSFDAQKVSTIRGIGCESHDALVMANGSLYTLDRNGIWELGNGQNRRITENIPEFWKSVNFNVAGEFSGVHRPEFSWIIWSLATGGSGVPNYLLIYDYRNDAIWFRKKETHALAAVKDGSTDTKIMFGDAAGKVYTAFTGEDDNGTAISAYITWPVIGNELQGQKKLWDEVRVVGKNTGSHTSTLKSSSDGRLGDRMASTTYENTNGVSNQEEEFEAFVSVAHTGENIKIRIESDSTAGGPWAIRSIDARGRPTRD